MVSNVFRGALNFSSENKGQPRNAEQHGNHRALSHTVSYMKASSALNPFSRAIKICLSLSHTQLVLWNEITGRLVQQRFVRKCRSEQRDPLMGFSFLLHPTTSETRTDFFFLLCMIWLSVSMVESLIILNNWNTIKFICIHIADAFAQRNWKWGKTNNGA